MTPQDASSILTVCCIFCVVGFNSAASMANSTVLHSLGIAHHFLFCFSVKVFYFMVRCLLVFYVQTSVIHFKIVSRKFVTKTSDCHFDFVTKSVTC